MVMGYTVIMAVQPLTTTLYQGMGMAMASTATTPPHPSPTTPY